MSAFISADDGFSKTVLAIKLLFELETDSNQPFLWGSQLGFHGYSFSISQSHVDYLNSLNLSIFAIELAFDGEAINRWKLINELLLSGFAFIPPGQSSLVSQYPALAALAAFPTIEEIARKISKYWDEEGNVLKEIPEALGIYTWNSDGTEKLKSYKVGKRIVVLSHKLQLMDLSLEPALRQLTKRLDDVLRQPMIQGIEQPMSPMYERLQHYRDHWVHGRRYEGWEALFLSLYMGLIYFGMQKYAKQPPA